MQNACAVLYCHLWRVWLYHILPQYLISGTIFLIELLNINCVFRFSPQLLSETFLILRRNEREVIINVHRSSRKFPVFFLILMKRNFRDMFREILKFQIS